MSAERFDVVVIGSGPAGQKAAIQAVKAGRSVALLEREAAIGGSCVHRGTIPSKTLRAAALRATAPSADGTQIEPNIEVRSLTSQLESVVNAHAGYMHRQMRRNGVTYLHGRARFVGPHEVALRSLDGSTRTIAGDLIVIATGSRPREPRDIPIDHENILDSDSILSMIYLPRSLTVLGGGVIACEYASMFARLGVHVTMIDAAPRPLRFVDAEIVDRFLSGFAQNGGLFFGDHRTLAIGWDGVSAVRTLLDDGTEIRTEKMLVALGRVANVEDLNLPAAGLAMDDRGHVPVDEHCRTAVPHIYAVGDVIGPPALASTSMEQGRRAVCHALGLPPGHPPELSPIGIYTIPEIATVGLDQDAAKARHGSIIVGRARFDEVARGQIGGITDGLLKIVADGTGRQLLGVHIVGEGATELIHVAQMALLAGFGIDAFIENIFNFPTLAEAYRVAALDVAEQRQVVATALPPTTTRAA